MTETAQQPPPIPEPSALDRSGHCPWPYGVVELRKRREVPEALRKATTPDGPSERDEPFDDGP
ncbi:hypothetical protein [Streptomyces sp. NPDC059072]|uniref:hypothetical protein n=1 Tax=unclassified Streptomyces TaxID=2593676 RepID=UPI00368A9E50